MINHIKIAEIIVLFSYEIYILLKLQYIIKQYLNCIKFTWTRFHLIKTLSLLTASVIISTFYVYKYYLSKYSSDFKTNWYKKFNKQVFLGNCIIWSRRIIMKINNRKDHNLNYLFINFLFFQTYHVLDNCQFLYTVYSGLHEVCIYTAIY